VAHNATVFAFRFNPICALCAEVAPVMEMLDKLTRGEATVSLDVVKDWNSSAHVMPSMTLYKEGKAFPFESVLWTAAEMLRHYDESDGPSRLYPLKVGDSSVSSILSRGSLVVFVTRAKNGMDAPLALDFARAQRKYRVVVVLTSRESESPEEWGSVTMISSP
jgi:hypothetical protein